MGRTPVSGGGGGGGGTPPPSDGSGNTILQAILDLLNETFGLNQSEPHIDYRTLDTGGTFQAIYTGTMAVKSAIIQNISTENVTLTTVAITSSVAAKGILLTKANAAGEGGGSLPVGNVDLAKINYVRASAGVTLAVYYET